MGTTKNIEMREYNRSDYNLLLPKTDSYTKEETLASYTKSLLKLTSSAVPDDAFLALFLGVDSYLYRVKVQLSDGTPVSGSTISGLSAITGQTLTTGDDGIVLGKSTSASVTINCTSPYIDQKPPAAQTITKTGTITDVTLTLENVTDMITVSSSKTPKVSPMAKTMDVTAVGGGGGGGGGIYYNNSGQWAGGGGGGGGSVSTKLGLDLSAPPIIVIGSGGAGGHYGDSETGETGASGGTTTVSIGGNTIVRATGGGGGTSGDALSGAVGIGGRGNGNGGNGSPASHSAVKPGTNGSGYIFNDSSIGLAGGGGGGGGIGFYDGAVASGGSPFGGDSGQTGTCGGGGAGSGSNQYGLRYEYGGYGGNGVAYLRFHF